MMTQGLPVLALLVIAVPLTGAVVATPPDEDNGLSANESTTLWSRDDDSGYITNAEYREAYGESRSAMAELANGTDITFAQPPATARTWSRTDHTDFEAGGIETSVAPRGAERTDSRIIKDAHASVFTITPATVVHESAGEHTLYVTPTGTVRGVVDYRLALNATNGSRVLDHRIDEVRLLADERIVARTDGTHRPVLSYDIDPQVEQLTLEADLTARVERPTRQPNETNSSEPTIVEETLTVRDSRAVEVYILNPTVRTAQYPDGDSGVAVFQNGLWQGYSFGDENSVRGVWRFYTARDTDWDELTVHTTTGTERIASDAIPVAVHAYPSELGPQVRPTGSGIDLLQTWGTTNDPPVTLGENILAEVVERPYETTWGVATRQEHVGESVTIHGIVRGANTTLTTNGTTQQLREADLSLEVVDHTDEQVTLLATLRDDETGDPLVLRATNDSPIAPEGGDRAGYLTINDQVVKTNASGMVQVSVSETGSYTARYHPESWLSQEVAYTPATATARYHPLTTAEGWLWLVVDGLVWLSPFLLALFAGRTLSRFFSGSRYT